MNFKVGQKVVCVDSSGIKNISLGKTYTVTGISESCDCCSIEVSNIKATDIKGNLVLNGAKCRCITCNTVLISNGFAKFRADRFAPLQYTSCKGSAELAKKFVEVKERIESVPEKQNA